MKRSGLLGGMSWESTGEYYRLINELVARELGGLHSADCLLRSVDFAEIEVLQREDRWAEAGERLAREAQALEAAGAELFVLCTNTMHKVAAEIAPVDEAVTPRQGSWIPVGNVWLGGEYSSLMFGARVDRARIARKRSEEIGDHSRPPFQLSVLPTVE